MMLEMHLLNYCLDTLKKLDHQLYVFVIDKKRMIDLTIEIRDIIAMLVSVICGGIIGFEREYRNKSAGFRTIILISLGSTIFTIVSWHGTGTDDRISANIITGIGFIGAGVIFKDRISVRGLTTAAVIWTSAAIGMTAGVGYHALAFVLTISTLCVLAMVSYVEKIISDLKKERMITVTFVDNSFSSMLLLEKRLNSTEAKIERMEVSKEEGRINVVYLIRGKKAAVNKLNTLLAMAEEVASFS
jgi:putative Mg2+ transporter-C (MgtC) family protein